MKARDTLLASYRLRREYARASRTLDAAWRLVILVIGVSTLVVGLIFLVFPGPGWATIWLGLVVLATEFAWANRLLRPLRATLDNVSAKVRSARHTQRMVNGILLSSAVTVSVYAYVAVWGLTRDGFTIARTALSSLLPG